MARRRFWRGPWHHTPDAQQYCGQVSRRTWEKWLLKHAELTQYRSPRGEGVGRRSWAYPESLLDHVMNERALMGLDEPQPAPEDAAESESTEDSEVAA